MMMGCCTATGMAFGFLGMLTPLIATGAVLYLLAARPHDPEYGEAR